ncbi:MAG: hypothetical protein HYU57_08160 [Micavibrio aeruginosavorus]|nr:hypothetical protein [Micavibrio aeruginosavorus]
MKQRLSDAFGIAGIAAATAGTVGVASTAGVAAGALSGAFLFAASFAYLAKHGPSQEQPQQDSGKRGRVKDMVALGLVGALLGGTLGTMTGCAGNEKQCAPYIPQTIPVFIKQ